MPTTKKSDEPTKQTRKPAKKALGAAQLLTADAAVVANAGKSQLSDFLNFVREQGVVGLAVGLAIGAAAGATVKQIVDGLINPIVGFLIGGLNLTDLKWVVVAAHKDGTGGLTITWGAIVSSIITLLATAFVVYWFVHIAKLDRLDKKKD